MRSYRFWIICLSLFVAFESRAGIVLSEVMFDPIGDEDTDEFVELFNNSAFPVSLAGWLLTDGEGTDTLVDAGMGLFALPNQYVLILDPDYVEEGSSSYDGLVPEAALVVTLSGNTLGSRGLSNSSAEQIQIINSNGLVAATYLYSVGNLSGHSDEKRRLDAGDASDNWSDSELPLGTPGARNSVTPPEHDLGLYSASVEPAMPVSGEQFELRFFVTNTGLDSASSQVSFSTDSTGGYEWSFVESVSSERIAAGDSIELAVQSVMGESGILRCQLELESADDDTSNNRLIVLVSSHVSAEGIRLNEIQYDPLPTRSEWFEIAVVGTFPVALSGVNVSDGRGIADSTLRFPLPEWIVAPGQFVTVAMDSSIFSESLPLDAPVVVLEGDVPTLNNGGDSLILWSAEGSVLDRVDYRPNWGDDTQGVSLERISMTASSNDPANWASSTAPEGSTPGRVNSNSVSGGGARHALTATPSLFTPNGDGRDDVTEIHYEVSDPGTSIDLFVFDARGRQVRRLAGGQNVTSQSSVIWDGRDDAHQLLPTGRYILVLETARSGNFIQTQKTTVILARPK
ncbi:MAG: lamin tail domain-containing protein [Calditrichaeota bacterium]|nr:lamin tail domain-containing protein [Calditrichota bacterium]MCB9366422.1 lamin tail domain-containing protein [Calditrichota bacterium]